MKCVCGYIQEAAFPFMGMGVYMDGDAEAIMLDCKQIKDHELHKSTVAFICPKCGTLKLRVRFGGE